MSYTFSIKKDNLGTILEITIGDKIMEHDPLVQSYIEKCFERIFQIIKIASREEKKEEETEEETQQDEDIEKGGFFSVFN